MSEIIETSMDLKLLDKVVGPFAAANIAIPGSITQPKLDQLRGIYDARSHSDFYVESYGSDDPRTHDRQFGRLLHLPYRLSLGLHSSVADKGLNRAATVATYATYASTSTLFRGEVSQEVRMKHRARACLAGAIIEAAADDSFITEIDDAIRFTRRYGLLGYRAGRITRKATKLVEVIN